MRICLASFSQESMNDVSSIIDILNLSLEESGFKDMKVELDNSYDKKENPDLTRPNVVFKKK